MPLPKITVYESREVIVFITPQQLREIADDLEGQWNALKPHERWGREVPSFVIYGSVTPALTVKLAIAQEGMKQ